MKKYRFIFLIVLLVLAVFFYSQLTFHPGYGDLRIMGALGVVLLLVSLWSWKYTGKEWIGPYPFFLVALYLFSFGQSLLYAFDIVSEKRDLLGFQEITVQQLFDAQALTLIMLAFFHIGALLSLEKPGRHLFCPGKNQYTGRIRAVGWVLFVVSAVPYFSRLIRSLALSMAYGYGALYEGEEEVGVSMIDKYIADYFIPSLICLFVGYRQNKIMRYFIFGICLFNILAILLTGGRTYAVIIAALLVLLYHYGVRRISARGGVLLAAGSVFFLVVLSVVSQFRSEAGRNVAAYLQNDNQVENGVTEAIAEMGSTMFCLVKTREIVPAQEDYRFGRSYAYSFTSLIPNLGFWKMHPARREANLGDWLTNKLRLNYGTGYSMCAEAYINFGGFGWLMMLLLGFVLGKIFSKTNGNTLQENPALLIFSLILFWFCLKMTRNSFIGFVRALFYYALPVYYVIRWRGMPAAR